MTWEETIKSIRNKPEFKDLVRDAYFEEDLKVNVERFRKSEEYLETLKLIRQHQPDARVLVDIGSGNGISSIAFALEGYQVHAIEPDPSDTIGAGAIRILARQYHVTDRLNVTEKYGEETGMPNDFADVVYIRQAMHHASHLGNMMRECFRMAKPAGLLLTVRDHVIFDEKDKQRFLNAHPLHKFYGGENAFTEKEYRSAIETAGFHILDVYRFFDSVINYFPITKAEVERMPEEKRQSLIASFRKKAGALATLPLLQKLYLKYRAFDPAHVYNERSFPGRMYTFLARKPK
jgi:SAM-dependent methyltransferase